MTNEKKVARVVLAISPERRDQNGNVLRKEGSFWSEVGKAITNADDSITILLDAVPISGKLQIRDQRPREIGGAS